jgi:restriction system protein
MSLWLVRAGTHGEGEALALGHNVVGIGWADLGDLSEIKSLDAVRHRLQKLRPDAKPSTAANWAGQIDAFIRRIKVGDIVALPLKTAPAVAFGRVTGGYRFDPEATDEPE